MHSIHMNYVLLLKQGSCSNVNVRKDLAEKGLILKRMLPILHQDHRELTMLCTAHGLTQSTKAQS